MTRLVSKAEGWEKVYEAASRINFAAFDYETVKESLIEYIRLYHPESSKDWIESSEFVAILELFAYAAEIMAYRIDLAAHENFITVAQRKDSILRLAKLISYTSSRNLPARGLVKITSIRTSETIFDSSGIDLSNTTVIWDDPNNPTWKNQFILLLNQVFEQPFGTVQPRDRVQVDDVLFELYSLNNNPFTNGVIKYSATAANRSVPMELVSSSLTQNGPIERRPQNNQGATILYGSDGLGDSSDTTGFFFFTKQGSIQKLTQFFDGVTPNQTLTVESDNINEIDVWINNVDPQTGDTIDDGTTETRRSGEWVMVNTVNGSNIVFNTISDQNKFEVETLDDDRLRIIFGDGELAGIPNGTFDVWYRVSENDNIVITKSAIVNKEAAFTYLDKNGTVQTFTFTFSLINSLTNASESETIEHIRSVAPSVYYTQNRMVNGQDYNSFMLQDPSIVKLRTINRTFAGDSKYIAWHDPSNTYENVKIFGDDLILYFKNTQNTLTVNTPVSGTTLITNYIEPLLSTTSIFLKQQLLARDAQVAITPRSFFRAGEVDPDEREDILHILGEATVFSPTPGGGIFPVGLTYDPVSDTWTAENPAPVDSVIIIDQILQGSTLAGWSILDNGTRLIGESQSTKFWFNNKLGQIIDYDSIYSNPDLIVILKANPDGADRIGSILNRNYNLPIVGLEPMENGLPNSGLFNIHQFSLIPEDLNGDAVPDDPTLSELLNPVWSELEIQFGDVVLPQFYIKGFGDIISVEGSNFPNGATSAFAWTEDTIVSDRGLSSTIKITEADGETHVIVKQKDYVLFYRPSTVDAWTPIPYNAINASAFALQVPVVGSNVGDAYKRENGRDNLNFLWMHRTPRRHLVDPAASNIHDTFIISRGYFISIREWLDGLRLNKPADPTPQELRLSYNGLLDGKMLSDTVILHPGKIKVLFGNKAQEEVRAKLKIIKSPESTLTDNQIKVRVVSTVKNFFNIDKWEFGETFYFTELSSAIHNDLPSEIDSVVIVPTLSRTVFGDMFEITAAEDEIFQPHITVNDIEIVSSYTPINIKQLN